MGEFLSGGSFPTEFESQPILELSSEFRTYLGSKTDYGVPYTSKIARDAITEFLGSHGARNELIIYTNDAGQRVKTTEAASIAGSIIRTMGEGFEKSGKKNRGDHDDDAGEKRQLTRIHLAIRNRIAIVGSEVSQSFPDDKKSQARKERLERELTLLKILVTN